MTGLDPWMTHKMLAIPDKYILCSESSAPRRISGKHYDNGAAPFIHQIRLVLFSSQMFWSAILSFSILQFHYYANAQSLQDMAQFFLTTHIVPDILPAFNPSVLLEVSFDTPIIPGQNLTKNGTELESLPVF